MRKFILITLLLLALVISLNSERFSANPAYLNSVIDFSGEESKGQGKQWVRIDEIRFECVECTSFEDTVRIFVDVTSNPKTPGHRIDRCELTVPEAIIESQGMVSSSTSDYEKTYTKRFKVTNENITVTVKCKSKSGNIGKRTENFNISECIRKDTKPPETIIIPSADALRVWQQGPVNITLECEDDFSGCKKINYFIAKASEGNKFLEGIEAIESRSLRKMAELFSESTEKEIIEFNNVNEIAILVFASEDKAGNIEDAKNAIIRIDNQAPVTEYIGPEGEINKPAEITFYCTDFPEWDINKEIELVSGCSKTRYRINDGSWQSYAGKIRIEESGEYKIKYYSVDNAGNTENIEEKGFVIKEIEERPLEIASGPNAVAIHESVEITWVSNKTSDALVRYGKTTELLKEKYSDINGVSHSVEIKGLDSKTEYYYKAVSFTENEIAESEILSFKTIEKPVEEDLGIIDVEVLATDKNAEISWRTLVKGSCEVSFWEEGSKEYTKRVSENEEMHSIKISGLLASTRHGFEIRCIVDSLSSSYAGSFYTRSAETAKEPAEPVEIEQAFAPGSSELEHNNKINGEKIEPDPPKIRRLKVDPVSRVMDEGQLFIFEVDLFPDLAYEYVWDYGDGTAKEITREPKSEYAYYFEDDDAGIWEKDFLVTVRVRDTRTRKESVVQTVVTVKRAAFKARMIQPRPGELLEKGGEALLKIVFLDIENNIIDSDKIKIKPVSVDRTIWDARFNENVLEVRYIAGFRTTNQKIVEVEAEAEIGNRTEKIEAFLPIRFKPIEIVPINPFEGREYYRGSLLKTYRIALNLKDTFRTKMEYAAGYLESSTYRKRINTSLLPNATALEINHFIEETDLQDGLFIRLEGRDYYGNTLNALVEVPINSKNPAFQIHLVKPKERGYARGETAKIISKLESDKGLKGELEVVCGENIGKAEYDNVTGLYYFSFNIPENYEKNEMECKIYGWGEHGENLFKDIKQFSFPVYDVSAEFLIPAQGTSSSLLPINKIMIEVKYGDGTPFTAKKINGKININGEESNITFIGSGNVFTADLAKPLDFGENMIRLTVIEPIRFDTEVYADLTQGFELYQIILLLAVSAAFVLIAHKKFKSSIKVKSAREQLEFEKNQLEELLKKIKIEYFKRRISKTEYKERRNAVKARIKKINKILKKKS